jgi:peptidoglycan/LPS O-acetylase OafA/YrhL
MSHQNLFPNFPAITVGEILADLHNGLTFIRLLLSLLVLLAHSYELGGFGSDPLFSAITRGQHSTGALAVHSFMLLSGLLVTGSFERQPLKVYFINRSLRIFPGYLCSLLIIALLFGPTIAVLSGVDVFTYFSTYHNGPWTYLAKNCLLAIHQTGIMNLLAKNPFPYFFAGSHWTIWPEFQGYFVIAMCGLLGFLRKFRLLIAPFTCLYILSLVAIYHPETLSNLGDLRKLNLGLYLLSGMMLYCLRDRIVIDRQGLSWSILGFALCIFVPIWNWVMPFLLGYLLLVLARILPASFKKFEKVGDFSYGIYLYHFSIAQIASLIGIERIGFLPYLMFVLLLTIPCGVLSWYFVEKPANSLRRLFVQPQG